MNRTFIRFNAKLNIYAISMSACSFVCKILWNKNRTELHKLTINNPTLLHNLPRIKITYCKMVKIFVAIKFLRISAKK